MADKNYGQFTEATETDEIVYLVGYLNTAANGERRINITKVLNGSNAIPLSGTEDGEPVTGDIELYNADEGLSSYIFIDDNVTGLFAFGDPNNYNIGATIIQNNSGDISRLSVGQDEITVESDNVSYKGINGQSYYGANYTDNTYVQKKYVDDEISASTPDLSSVLQEGAYSNDNVTFDLTGNSISISTDTSSQFSSLFMDSGVVFLSHTNMPSNNNSQLELRDNYVSLLHANDSTTDIFTLTLGGTNDIQFMKSNGASERSLSFNLDNLEIDDHKSVTFRDGDINFTGGVTGDVLTLQSDGSLLLETLPSDDVQEFAPTNGSNSTATQDPNVIAILTPAATIATGTFTFPASPIDGDSVVISNGSAAANITALTLVAAGKTIISALTTILAGGFAKYKYVAANNTWYRIG